MVSKILKKIRELISPGVIYISLGLIILVGVVITSSSFTIGVISLGIGVILIILGLLYS